METNLNQGIPQETMLKQFKGDVVYNQEGKKRI
jgi:hypothetical protein